MTREPELRLRRLDPRGVSRARPPVWRRESSASQTDEIIPETSHADETVIKLPNCGEVLKICLGPRFAALLLEGGNLALLPIGQDEIGTWQVDGSSSSVKIIEGSRYVVM